VVKIFQEDLQQPDGVLSVLSKWLQCICTPCTHLYDRKVQALGSGMQLWIQEEGHIEQRDH
jgi:hypothetical protein